MFSNKRWFQKASRVLGKLEKNDNVICCMIGKIQMVNRDWGKIKSFQKVQGDISSKFMNHCQDNFKMMQQGSLILLLGGIIDFGRSTVIPINQLYQVVEHSVGPDKRNMIKSIWLSRFDRNNPIWVKKQNICMLSRVSSFIYSNIYCMPAVFQALY